MKQVNIISFINPICLSGPISVKNSVHDSVENSVKHYVRDCVWGSVGTTYITLTCLFK